MLHNILPVEATKNLSSDINGESKDAPQILFQNAMSGQPRTSSQSREYYPLEHLIKRDRVKVAMSRR